MDGSRSGNRTRRVIDLKKADMIASVLLFFFGIGFVYESMKLSSGHIKHIRGLGPGFFPFWIGVLFALLSLALLVSSLRARGMEKISWPNRRMVVKLLSIVMILFLYIAVMGRLGYAISTAMFCTCLIKIVLDRYRWVDAAIIASIISIALTVVFQVWFKVSLPQGIFVFLRISTVLWILAAVSILLFLVSFYGRLSKARENWPHREER